MNLYIKKISFLLLSLVFVFTACETEESIQITSPDPALVLQQPGISNVFLNFGTPSNAAITLSWNDDLTGSTSYDVEMSLDAEFTSIVSLGTVSSKSFSISVEALNAAIRSSGTTNFRDVAVYLRVNGGSVTSNAVQYLVTTYPTEPPVVTSPAANSTFVLSIATLDEIAMTVTWTDAVLSSALGIDVNYTIQAAKPGTDFAAPVSIGSKLNGTTITSSHSDLNAVAIGIGLTAEVAGNMDIRIIAKTTNQGGSVLERISEKRTVSITPFNVSFPNLYLVGDATTAGWENNNNNNPLFRDQNTPNAYVYIGYFKSGAFKLLENKGSWHRQWGVRNGSTLGVSNLDGSNEAGTFNVTTAGYYKYNFTTVGESGSFTVAPYDASSATTYTTMGIIGEGIGGWGDADEINFIKDTNNPHLWYSLAVEFTNDKDFLIRANDMWNDVWRYTGSKELYGKARLDSNGDNFKFTEPSGFYDVWFNDLDGSYVIIPN
ncbi:SusE domain-containing protein [Mariniflexile soesokkakense]|uniref:SusE domain-containing protein n=1 Tax=Mariniflexile soesokkakense TaxID=1343160 RepID=A0ABV0AFY2_9FLAO